MSMLAELVELVIGVDAHAHTAAMVEADTRAVLATTTVTADEDGYAELAVLTVAHGGLRGWRSRAPVDTARAWPGTSPRSVSWSSSLTARSAPRAGLGRSPM